MPTDRESMASKTARSRLTVHMVVTPISRANEPVMCVKFGRKFPRIYVRLPRYIVSIAEVDQ